MSMSGGIYVSTVAKKSYDENDGKITDTYKKLYKATTIEQNSYELIINVADTSYYRSSPHQLKIRKSGNFTSFKFNYLKRHDDGPLFDREVVASKYGYCWKE